MTAENTPSMTFPPDLRLANVARCRSVRVVGVEGEDALAERLRASGIWADTVVSVVGSAPFGDPLLIELHGFRLALRRSEADRVAVEPVDASESAGSRA